MRDDDWYKPHPDRPAAPSRQPQPGEEVWRLRDNETGRVQTCELRDNSRAVPVGKCKSSTTRARSSCRGSARLSAKRGTSRTPLERISYERVRFQ
jgi:hypothetical protein